MDYDNWLTAGVDDWIGDECIQTAAFRLTKNESSDRAPGVLLFGESERSRFVDCTQAVPTVLRK